MEELQEDEEQVEEKKGDGKMMEDENDEKIDINLKCYYQFFKKYWQGWTFLIAGNLTFIAGTMFWMSGDYVIGYWTTKKDQSDSFWYYAGLSVCFAVSTCMMIGVRFAFLYYYSWHSSKKLHEDMIEKILQAPVNLYFDITPIGKSLNKFSKDLNHLQGGFHYTIDGTLACSYSVMQVGFISVYAVWQIGFVFPFIMVASVILMRKTLKSIKECGRLRATSSSPLISFLTESLNGVSTIRAFN